MQEEKAKSLAVLFSADDDSLFKHAADSWSCCFAVMPKVCACSWFVYTVPE